MENYNRNNNTLCAIVDCQGYVKGGKFVPKEFAISFHNDLQLEVWCTMNDGPVPMPWTSKTIFNGNCLRFDIDTKLNEFSMSASDRQANRYIQNKLTGLDYGPKTERHITLEQLPLLVKRLYNVCKKRETDVFGVNNNQFEEMLTTWEIPYTKLQVPPIDVLDRKFDGKWACDLHSWPTAKCALRKVIYIKKWLDEDNSWDILLLNLTI